MATKKQEKKLNNLWGYLCKVGDKKTLQAYNMRAFLYSVGRLSYEQVLIELVALYFGKTLQDEELKGLIQIIEGDQKHE